MRSIYDTLRDQTDLSTFCSAVETSEQQVLLSEYGPNTLFAPSDDAFDRLSIEYRDRVLNDEGFLRELVDNHVVAGAFRSSDLEQHPFLRTNASEDLPVRDVDGLRVGGARILRTLVCENGVIHVTDSVLVPYEREDRLSA
jgi:uncharacterized surface protein with fasciclin (FAS1) repeats